jgi:hypothetical protein
MRLMGLFTLVAVLISLPARAAVVINEIFYHAGRSKRLAL